MDYYSPDCSVYCVANDTHAGGHYTCDPVTGNITCRKGRGNKNSSEDETANVNVYAVRPES